MKLFSQLYRTKPQNSQFNDTKFLKLTTKITVICSTMTQVINTSSMESVKAILQKKSKTPQEVEILKERFEKVKFFADSEDKIDSESFSKLLKTLQYEKRGNNGNTMKNV